MTDYKSFTKSYPRYSARRSPESFRDEGGQAHKPGKLYRAFLFGDLVILWFGDLIQTTLFNIFILDNCISLFEEFKWGRFWRPFAFWVHMGTTFYGFFWIQNGQYGRDK